MSAAAHEVAVVGGGPAGCSTAIALRRLGVERVVLIEASAPDGGRVRVGESIPPDSRALLDRLGAWERFAADGHEPCLGSCSVWGDGSPGYNDFLFNPHGHGWHLDRGRFDASLLDEAEAAGVVLVRGAPVGGVERADGGLFELRLSGGGARPLRARFAVDASGRGSRVARALGARQRLHDRLTCVVAFMRRPAESQLTRLTLLEAVEHGWWYAARLPDEEVAVAVASDPEIVKGAALHTRAGWLAALGATAHLAGELPGCDVSAERMVARTAPSFVLDRAAGDGWLAVGDAAAACDPVSAQGIHNALRDGLRAAEAIAARIGGDADAFDGYRESVAARFAGYLGERNLLYGLERRWPDAPFWARRRARDAAAAA